MWVYTLQKNPKQQHQKQNPNDTLFSEFKLKQNKKNSRTIDKIKKYYIGNQVKTEENPYEFSLNSSEHKKHKKMRKSAFRQLVNNSAQNQIQLRKTDDGSCLELTKKLVQIKGVNPLKKKKYCFGSKKVNDEVDWSNINNSMEQTNAKNKFLTYEQQNELNKKRLGKDERTTTNHKTRYLNRTEGNQKQFLTKDIFANKYIKNLNLWEKVQKCNEKSEGKEKAAKKITKLRKTGDKEKQKKNKVVHTDIKINSMDNLQMIKIIGEGTFGKVYKAIIKSSRQQVAVKVFFNDKTYKSRQIQVLQFIKSTFIIKMHSHFITTQMKNGMKKQYINIVFDHYPFNFYEYIKSRRYKLEPLEIKIYLYQLFRGLFYLHSHNICHRDIKPQNLLINNGKLVICDLGSAKILKNDEKNISYICSRCYRAPQLIFGSTFYSTQIDIWSAGCIILQVLNKTPLFIARNSIQHLVQIIKILGTPTEEDIHVMNPSFNIQNFDVPDVKKKNWFDIFPMAEPKLIDLLTKIMIFNPEKRFTAVEVLSHTYFDEIRDKFIYSQIEKKINPVDFFNFNEKQFSIIVEKGVRKLIPSWYEKI